MRWAIAATSSGARRPAWLCLTAPTPCLNANGSGARGCVGSIPGGVCQFILCNLERLQRPRARHPLVAYPRRRRSARHRGCNSDTLSPTTPEPCTASRGPSIGPWPQHLIIAVASLPGLWSTADPRPAVAIGGHDNKKYYNTLLVHRVTEGMASCNIFLPRPCIQITGGSETPGSPLDTHTLVQKSKVATPASEFGQ